MASSLRPPIASAVSGGPSGYQGGGGLMRTITSNDLQPAESIVARRRGETTLRERRDNDRESLRRRSIEHGTADGAGTGRPSNVAEVEEKDAERNDAELHHGRRSRQELPDPAVGVKTEEPTEEWTFPDGGWKAWSVILGCFLMSVNVQGYGMAWGAMVGNLQQHHHPGTSLSILNLIVGLFNFGLNASPFVTGRLGEIFGFKKMIAIGSTISVILLILSACAVSALPALFILQGILLGIAHGISLPLFMTIPSQWFQKRRGLATGCVVSGAGFGGAFASLIMRGLLPPLGYRYALMVYAAISAAIYVVAFLLLETRKPPASSTPQRFDTKTGLPPGIWKDKAFWSLMIGISIGVWGFLSPSYFLTSATVDLNPSLDPNSLLVALPLILLNVAIGIGRVSAGFVADIIGPTNAMFASFFTGGILCLAFWSQIGEGQFGLLNAFAVLYGLLGSWFFLLMAPAAAQLFGLRGLATIVGYIVTSQSPGQLAGASVAGVVHDSLGNYSSVAYYAGSVLLAGSLCLLPARFSRVKKIWTRC